MHSELMALKCTAVFAHIAVWINASHNDLRQGQLNFCAIQLCEGEGLWLTGGTSTLNHRIIES